MDFSLSPEQEILREQRYKYFLPFKYYAEDFRRRLLHIERRLSDECKKRTPEKYNNMIIRLRQTLSDQLEWYFNDSVSSEGGYFFTSTVYMNCMLFYWMARIQWEYPYIPLRLNKSIDELSRTSQKNIIRCFNEGYNRFEGYGSGNFSAKKKVDIDHIINHVRVTMAGENGIAYGLHGSFGDFVSDHLIGKVINYEKFCTVLSDTKQRIKFQPLIKFWGNIIIDGEKIDTLRMQRIRRLIILLTLLKNASIL